MRESQAKCIYSRALTRVRVLAQRRLCVKCYCWGVWGWFSGIPLWIQSPFLLYSNNFLSFRGWMTSRNTPTVTICPSMVTQRWMTRDCRLCHDTRHPPVAACGQRRRNKVWNVQRQSWFSQMSSKYYSSYRKAIWWHLPKFDNPKNYHSY